MWSALDLFCCCVRERAVPHSRTPIRRSSPTANKRSPSATSTRSNVASSSSTNASRYMSSQSKVNDPAQAIEESVDGLTSSAASSFASSASSTSQSSDSSTSACKGKNYLFYQNKIPSKPQPGGLIDEIHAKWFGDYKLLEYHHGYIQWLFPVFESGGMSFHSSRLEKDEAACMRQDLKSSIRLVKSYKLMLDFYGMKLLDYETGNVGRHSNYKSRYENLNYNAHNYLRISRILMSLGELGFVRYKTPWMDFIQHELEDHNRLSNCKSSYKNFWRPLCDPTTPGYRQKTKETPEDRAESVFFQIMASGGEEWEAIKAELDSYGAPTELQSDTD